MSELFESFERLNRRWEDRALDGQSEGKVFVWSLLMIFLLGGNCIQLVYELLRHRVLWWNLVNIPLAAIIAFRYARWIYRRRN
jgi:hypothetical protein